MNTIGKFQILNSNDLKTVAELDQKFFPNPWGLVEWSGMNLDHHILLGWGDQGFALFGYMNGDDTAHLYKILLRPENRGSGEAEAFWGHIREFLTAKMVKNIYLEVEVSNERAIGFYKKLGFLTLRKAKSYYSNGSDALMMSLTL